MAQPYLGEIRMFGGRTPPEYWQFCDGQLLPITDYYDLFSLIGTTYGGDGQDTFALPDLRGRIPVHMDGSAFTIGTAEGTETVTLTANQMPVHDHPMMASANPAASRGPVGGVLARTPSIAYASEFTPQPLSGDAVAPMGATRSHSNVQPFLCINFIIATSGLFPHGK